MGKTNHKKSQLWHELKRLWDQFDPLGVYERGSEEAWEEYDSYVSPTLQLLEDEADFNEVNDYVKYVVVELMEPSLVTVTEEDITLFAQKIQQWYARKR